VASCASCHGAHEILPRDDPASTINAANLVQTCGQCHEGATANFAASPVHIVPTDPGQRATGIVRLVYIWLIVVLIGGMIFHNSLLMLRHMAAKFRAELRGPNTYRRFSPGQTFGHFVLMVAFIVLAISGFALRFPDNYWLKMVFFNGASIELRSTVHRWAGAALIALLIVHLLHGAFSRRGRKEALSLLPRPRDVRDLLANLRYAVGLASTQPKYDRYSYSEKLEYWGMMWGSVLMGITGVCMWFAEDFMQFFSKVFLDVAAAIHYYEAWLAIGTILVWHMYYMILDPQTYPMNWSWITGRITEEDFKERHALEFEREQQEKEPAPPTEPKPASEPMMASTMMDWEKKK
jgi:formate dehydrogenase gamma subunit